MSDAEINREILGLLGYERDNALGGFMHSDLPKVFGVPDYCTDAAAALGLLEHLCTEGWECQQIARISGLWGVMLILHDDADEHKRVWAEAVTLTGSIATCCLYALRAIGEQYEP